VTGGRKPGPSANLPARSVLLSVLLGSHPPRLPVRTLVRTAGLFGISDGSARVALSRLTADGEVVGVGGTYELSDRHRERQRHQDRALRPATRPWKGEWEMAVLLSDQADVRRTLAGARLAELRPGVWVRPDNLSLPELPASVARWRGRPAGLEEAPAHLAARLWDLSGWAEQAHSLLEAMSEAADPAVRLGVAAAMVRHIRTDPVLPPELLPADWPGLRLRRDYDEYRAELGRLIAGLRDE
jgi:phenylacetic acid degradation operon negative regulatory protein